jgi:glycosyltransferase involved in cell wall biosynthesis
MKILIDDGLLSIGRKSGIGHHIVSLVQKLEMLVHCDVVDYQYIQKLPRYIRKWAYIGWSSFTKEFRKYEIVHHLNNFVPRKRGKELHLMTIYDLSVLHYPETISLGWRHYNHFAFRKGVERAGGLIVISESIKKELLIKFPSLDSQKVFFCPPGIRESIINIKPTLSQIEALGLEPYEYFLFIGDLTKRKNLYFLLQTFIHAKEKRKISTKTQLILVGKPAWGFNELKSMINEDLGIRRIGYLEDDNIAALYRYCKALVYPSLYEGFGMPLIEAMWHNAPIIASAIPTSVELNDRHNNQLLLFELGNKSMLTNLLEEVDKNAERLRSLLDYGDITQYKYEAIAKRHLEIYKTILDQIHQI